MITNIPNNLQKHSNSICGEILNMAKRKKLLMLKNIKFYGWFVRKKVISEKLWWTFVEKKDIHTSYLSREPRVYPCKFFLASVNFYRFNVKSWHFRQILREKVAFFFFTDLTRKICVFGVNFILQKFCLCKKMTNIRYGLVKILNFILLEMLMFNWEVDT